MPAAALLFMKSHQLCMSKPGSKNVTYDFSGTLPTLVLNDWGMKPEASHQVDETKSEAVFPRACRHGQVCLLPNHEEVFACIAWDLHFTISNSNKVVCYAEDGCVT